MSILSSIFTGGIGELFKTASNLIDNLHTSEEEKLNAKRALEEQFQSFKKTQLDAQAAYDAEITKRHSSDMMSDNWLSKSARPVVLWVLTATLILFAVATTFWLPATQTAILKAWLPILGSLVGLVYTFYFGSRGMEKVADIRKPRKERTYTIPSNGEETQELPDPVKKKVAAKPAAKGKSAYDIFVSEREW